MEGFLAMKAGKAGLKWRDVIFLAVGLALAIAGFGAYHTTQGAAIADGTEAAAKHDAPILAAEPIVEASPSAQKASGIETAPILPKRVQPTTHVYADVPDLQSLFDLRNKWASGKADLNAAQAQYAIAQAQYRRNTVLFDGKHTVSEQTLQDSRAAMLTSQAKSQSAEANLAGIEAMLRQQFGNTLEREATSPHSTVVDRLAAGKASVVRISLARDTRPPERISLNGPGNDAVTALKLSASPQSDTIVQGRPFFYLADKALPTGTRLSAEIPLADDRPGLLIPVDAILWYGGQRWVYVRKGAGSFQRRLVPEDAFSSRDGLIVAGGFEPGEEIVVRGAQLLLSEELRPHNIATACKDPPECDD